MFKSEDPCKIPNLGRSPYPSLNRIRVTCGVKKLLLKLDPKKAVGPDLVPTQILRDYAKEIAPILQVIFQQPLDTGKVPDQWKTANVSGIFKKGDKHAAANYRSASYTCVSCKLLEHILFPAIMDDVDRHKILKFFQHGFRAKHSCETQLINTIEDLANGLDHQQQLDLVFLTFIRRLTLWVKNTYCTSSITMALETQLWHGFLAGWLAVPKRW